MSTPNRDLLRGWLDPKEWWRLGRGRTFDFALSRRDVIAAIHHLGASDGHDFDVVVCGSEKPPGERFYRSTHRVISVDELLAEPATNQFLRSRRLTPALPKIEPGWDWRWDAACSLNGLVGITYSVSRKSPSPRTWLGIVHRVEHRATGEVVEHVEYNRIFDGLKARLRKAMQAPTDVPPHD